MTQFSQQADKVLALDLILNQLPAADQTFAKSLVKQGNAKLLSEKQLYWVDKFLARGLGQEVKPVAEQVEVGSFEGLINLFNKAKGKLKFPKLYLSVTGNKPVTVSVAGNKSKAPGTVNVVGAGTYPDNIWYGRVSPEGVWSKGFKQYQEQGEVEDLLKALSRNPAKAAKAYGTLSGCCCFCGKALTDEKSTAAGFGPVCAKNWGLQSEYKKATSFLDSEVEQVENAESKNAEKEIQAELLAA